MTMKKNLIIATLVIVALAVLVTFTQDKTRYGQKDDAIGKPIHSGFYGDSFDSLTILDRDNTTTITHQDGIWKIKEKDNYPAAIKKISDIIDKLNTIQIASLTTSEVAMHGKFKLIQPEKQKGAEKMDTGVLLEFFKGGAPVFQILVGKSRESAPSGKPQSTPGGTYIRINNKPNVYLIKESLFWSSAPESWIKEGITFQKEQIKMIQIEKGSSKMTLSREQEKEEYQLVPAGESKKIDKNALSSLTDSFGSITVSKPQKISAESQGKLFSSPSDKVTLAFFDKRVVRFLLKQNEKDKDNYHLQIVLEPKNKLELWQKYKTLQYLSDNWFFEIPKWTVDQWLKKKDDLLQGGT